MYIWKCWRETRVFCLVFLGAGALLMPLAAAFTLGTQLLETFGRPAFEFTISSILMVTSLWLGMLGAYHSFDDRSIQFLFTKPRPRAYFLWTGWAVGLVELLVIASVNVVAGWLTLSAYKNHMLMYDVFGPHARETYTGIFLLALLTYSTTYAFTAALRSGVNGLGACFAAWGVYELLVVGLRYRWHVMLPYPVEQMGDLPIWLSNALWLAIGVSFVVSAQFAVQRAEV